MEITRDTLKKYGKLAGIGVVGAGLGAGGLSYADNGPTQEKYKNLQDKVSDLNESNSDLQEELDNRPTQEVVDSLQEELDARPTEEVVDNLETTIQEKNDKIDSLFTQEEVDEDVADATEREGLVDYLPVVVDEDVELERVATAVDSSDSTPQVVTGANLDDHDYNNLGTNVDADYNSDLEYDEVYVTYADDENHEYHAVVRTFSESENADEYEEEARQVVDNQDYEDSIHQDAEVVRDGDTVVYLYGQADTSDYDSYDFDAVASQY